MWQLCAQHFKKIFARFARTLFVPPLLNLFRRFCLLLLSKLHALNLVNWFWGKQLKCCHQMPYFKAKIHQIWFRLGLYAQDPAEESLLVSSWIWAVLLLRKGNERGKGRKKEKKKGREKERGKGRQKKGGKSQIPQKFWLRPWVSASEKPFKIDKLRCAPLCCRPEDKIQ